MLAFLVCTCIFTNMNTYPWSNLKVKPNVKYAGENNDIFTSDPVIKK